jgi:putative membrane protein
MTAIPAKSFRACQLHSPQEGRSLPPNPRRPSSARPHPGLELRARLPLEQIGRAKMSTPIEGKPGADLRDYLAEERTFLAWIRTGIALIAFGFVAAHFGLFADEPSITRHASAVQPHGFSLWFGTALIAIGVGVNLFSARRYARLVGELNRGQFVYRSPSKGAVIVALFLALLGIAMTIYLTLVLAQPPDALHA